jgi:hypothetical protein
MHQSMGADLRDVHVVECAQVAVNDAAMLHERRRRPAAGLVSDPLLTELAERTAVTWRAARPRTRPPRPSPGDGRRAVRRVDHSRLVAVRTCQRVTFQRDPQLPAARRQPTNADSSAR